MSIGEFLAPLNQAISILLKTAVYWAPILLLITFVKAWLSYVQAKFRAGLEWTVLEIKIPREISKSPRAMELVLHAFHQTSDGSKLKQWFEGKIRAWFSLELVSIEGKVHFFIYTQRFFVDLLQSQIYSQYPEVEIHEVDDYTRYVNYGKEDSDWDLFGTEFKFTQPDPYPIKTYIDYELDKDVKEDNVHIEPMGPLIELLGSLGPGEQLWMQIPIQAAKKRFHVSGTHFKKETWKDRGRELVKELSKKNVKPPAGQDYVSFADQMLSPGERGLVESVERNISKIGFDCGLRSIYLAKKDTFKDIRKPSLIGSVKQFNAEDRNGFKPNGDYTTDFDYPWQDFKNIRLSKRKRAIFNAYRKRSYFYAPYKRTPMTLSAEELATLYHFPGSSIETPTFDRIPSKTSEPPSNLPRG